MSGVFDAATFRREPDLDERVSRVLALGGPSGGPGSEARADGLHAAPLALPAEIAAGLEEGTIGADLCVTDVNVGTGERLERVLSHDRRNVQDVFELLAQSGGHGHLPTYGARLLADCAFGHGDASACRAFLPLEHSDVVFVLPSPSSPPPSPVTEGDGGGGRSGGGGGWEQ